MLSIAFSQSKYYIDNLAENVKRGIRQKLRNGVYPNKAPIGYLNEPRTRMIEIDSKTGPLVQKAFSLYSTGKYTYVDIDKFFFAQGITSSTNKYLRMDKIRKMLRNPFYFGNFEFGGETYQEVHKPLISKLLFDKCQEVIKRKSKTHFNHKDEFQFLGLAKCKECGSAITAGKHFKFYPKTRGRVRYDYYRCGKKHGKCSQKYIPASEIEKQIRDILFKHSINEFNSKILFNFLHADEIQEKESSEKKSIEVKRNLDYINQRLERLLTGYLEEELINLKNSRFNWVELVKEFIETAIESQKAAREKDNEQEVKNLAVKIGSNYFLENLQLNFIPSRGFKKLAAVESFDFAQDKGAASENLPILTLRRIWESNPLRAIHPASLANLCLAVRPILLFYRLYQTGKNYSVSVG